MQLWDIYRLKAVMRGWAQELGKGTVLVGSLIRSVSEIRPLTCAFRL
jgi:hypothetical protein